MDNRSLREKEEELGQRSKFQTEHQLESSAQFWIYRSFEDNDFILLLTSC